MTESLPQFKDRIIEAVKEIRDPELPVNIYELGLVYDIKVDEEGLVSVVMTLTTPNCPVAESFPGQVKSRIENVDGVTSANVELVFDPPWKPDMMSEAAKMELEFMGLGDIRALHSPFTSVTVNKNKSGQSKR